MEKAGIPLKDWDLEIYRGIVTGYNDAFIIDGKKRAELISADPKAAKIIKPVLRGKDIKRYTIDRRDEWIINSHNGLKAKKIPAVNIHQNFPSVYLHLKQFLPKCEQRADQGDHWANLRNCAFLEEFGKEKIIWGNLALAPSYALDTEQTYIIAPSNMLTSDTENLKYLLAVLNSKLLFFIFGDIAYARGGNFYEFKKVFVEQLPIIRPPADVERKLESLVTDIQGMKKTDPKANTSALEAQIDALVYELYGLTEEEIAVVEGKHE